MSCSCEKPDPRRAKPVERTTGGQLEMVYCASCHELLRPLKPLSGSPEITNMDTADVRLELTGLALSRLGPVWSAAYERKR